MKPLKIIFSGGGTGGHIFPAIAIANAVKRKVPEAEILFVGALGRMEMEKVPAAGYNIEGIPIAGLQRKWTLSNLKLPILIIRSIIRSGKILKRFKPNVVVGTGGYASGPLLRAAAFMRIPILIQEQNSYAGITNRILARKASRICVAYRGMEAYFPKNKIRLTGNPVREDVVNIDGKREEAMRFFKLENNKPVLLILGGSLGAKAINEAIAQGIKSLLESGIQVIWQSGRPFYPTALKLFDEFKGQGLELYEFINRMDLAYACADVVVSRAGAGAISELCLVKKPSILVPLPTAAEDHQTKNAMALVNQEAAIVIKDELCQKELVQAVIKLINDQARQQSLSCNIASLAQSHADEKIALEVLELASFVTA